MPLDSSAAAAGALGSVGARAWLVSALVHGSVAVTVATAVHVSTPAPLPPVSTIEVQVDAPPAPPVVVPPPPIEPDRVIPPEASPSPTPHAHVARAQVAAAPPPSATVEASAVVFAPSSAPPTFVMALPSSFGAAPSAPSQAPSSQENANEVVDESGVSSRAVVAYQPVAPYPVEARAADYEADVPVDIVVDPSGKVIEARLPHAVGYGLDEAALETVRRTQFHPAQRHGRAVAVRMRWTMQFRLR